MAEYKDKLGDTVDANRFQESKKPYPGGVRLDQKSGVFMTDTDEVKDFVLSNGQWLVDKNGVKSVVDSAKFDKDYSPVSMGVG